MKIQSRSRNNFAPKETKAFVSKQVKRNAKWVNEDHLCHLCLFWLVLQCLQNSTQQAQNPKSIFNLKHCTITQIFQQPHYSLKNKGRGTCLHEALLYAPRDCRIVLKKLYQDIKEMKIFFCETKYFPVLCLHSILSIFRCSQQEIILQDNIKYSKGRFKLKNKINPRNLIFIRTNMMIRKHNAIKIAIAMTLNAL